MNRAETLDAALADVAVGQKCTAEEEGVRCTSDAVVVGIKGCVHEHVRSIASCAYDHGIAEAGEMLCAECLKAGHDCWITVVYR